MTMQDFNFTATAPLVGHHHKKSKSLVGFDPLLADECKSEPLTLSPKRDAGSPGTPPEAEGRENGAVYRVNQEELASELRAIASELGKASPSRNLFQQQLQQQQVQSTSAILKGRDAVSPHRTRSGRNIRRIGAAPSPGPKKQLPWQKKQSQHRKARSLDANTWRDLQKQQEKVSKSNLPRPITETSKPAISSEMIQDLWQIQQQSGTAQATPSSGELAMPSLVKPRPTSFLTGKEVVLASEAEATEWQLEIPNKTEFNYTCRASSFLDNYRSGECVLNLSDIVGFNSTDLAGFANGLLTPAAAKIGEYNRTMVESLLECGSDLLQVQGHIRSGNINNDPTNFREVLILERQRQFLCVFRGTTAEQQGKKERQSETVKLSDNNNVTVFSDRYKAFHELEPQLFAKLDQLKEDNPFCDFVFAGHGFAGAMATLAAYRYAWARSELRVAALLTGSARVGLPDFRLSANSLPNLKIFRVELGHVRDPKNVGVHVGHTIRVNPAKLQSPVKAFRFSDCKQDPSPIRKLRLGKEKTLADYVNALDDLGSTWISSFYRQDGAGVKGTDNETRQVV